MCRFGLSLPYENYIQTLTWQTVHVIATEMLFLSSNQVGVIPVSSC